MLNHNPFAFVLFYLAVAALVILVEPLRNIVILIAQVMAAVAFLAFIFCIVLETWQERQRKNQE